jgi:RNA polymerase sigma-70 factor (ECF subfamily)
MAQSDDFSRLMGRLRAGDENASAEVFDLFTRRLLGLARRRLEGVIGGKEDPAEVVQSVFRSFFRRQREGQFRADGWDDLWRILTVITLRKCCNRVEYFRAARRDVRREVPLAEADKFLPSWEAVARDPTPSEAAVLTETLEWLMSGLGETDREVLSLHLQGYTAAEIGERVGYTQRTVRRTLEAIRNRLRGHLVGDRPPG